MEQKNENVDILKKEIELVLDRNKDENYLKSLLTRALILEKIYKKGLKGSGKPGPYFFVKPSISFLMAAFSSSSINQYALMIRLMSSSSDI